MDTTLEYWQQLLRLKEKSKQNLDSDLIAISLASIDFYKTADDSVSCSELIGSGDIDLVLSRHSFYVDENKSTEVLNGKLHAYFAPNTNQAVKDALMIYAPLAIAQWLEQDLPFVLVHMAQTLDGKVCTNSGTSKWIGNDQNLIHAHRVRALVDGVLVGANTARTEKPSLNVRHVSGPNPARIILCSSSASLDDLPDISDMQNFLLCNAKNKHDVHVESLNLGHVKALWFDEISSHEGMSACLGQLKTEGVHSILVEGGPTTIKTFMQSSTINWLQLHIAPMVFGSGHAFVDLPEISDVNQASLLSNVHYAQMGDAIMVTGEL